MAGKKGMNHYRLETKLEAAQMFLEKEQARSARSLLP